MERTNEAAIDVGNRRVLLWTWFVFWTLVCAASYGQAAANVQLTAVADQETVPIGGSVRCEVAAADAATAVPMR